MSFGDDISETFSQIDAAGGSSNSGVNVSITGSGNIIGQGITASAHALNKCGGNLDAILRSFGASGGETEGMVAGGAEGKIKHKVDRVMSSAKHSGDKVDKHLEKQLKELHNHAVDLEEFAVLAKSALKDSECGKSMKDVLEKIANHTDAGARAMRSILEKDLKQPKQKVSEFLARNKQFSNAIETLGARLNGPNVAGMISLSFTNVNELKKIGKEVSEALKDVDMKKKEYLGQSLFNLDAELTKKLNEALSKHQSSDKLRKFLKGWKTLLEHQGYSAKLESFIGGTNMGNKLADRLYKSREELKNLVNKFIAAFGKDLNTMVSDTNELAKHLGKDIQYTDETIQFMDAFTRLNEYLRTNRSKFYQHLLEINTDQVDSKEIKSRFLNNLRVLSDKAKTMGNSSIIKKFAETCDTTIDTVHKFSDMVKTFREDVKKDGGNATDVMNELYSVDASKIEISALVNPLENLEIAIKKLQLFKNIAIFRSNLSQTGKELATYSKDYEKSVGKSIGEAISRITNEYTEIINQISDNKAGMGLEIDMYNESLEKDKKISKEKLKMMYKWQCDARVGLYKTIEAIDLYLLHFTDAISKNPDAVSDLHKLLSATRIIARWYDVKAGENLIRVFESFGEDAADANTNPDSDGFIVRYDTSATFADLSVKLSGDRANQVYDRCRRAVQGVVVLKNIISYFISLGEKYGDFKTEKSIYMAPSNIYKNLVNYIWVSALDINTTGTEILTDNNETKRLLTYEDAKVKLAQITDTDPETMGINFNRHSMDKLRILKSHNELLRLKDSMASMTDLDIRRVKQFVAGVFARLGKTDYIFNMFLFGVYDLTMMDAAQIGRFVEFIERTRLAANVFGPPNGDGVFNQANELFNPLGAAGNRAPVATITFTNIAGAAADMTSNAAGLVDALAALTTEQRNAVRIQINYNARGAAADIRALNAFISLRQFMAMTEDTYAGDDAISSLNGLLDSNRTNPAGNNNTSRFIQDRGFLRGFLSGLTSNTQSHGSVVYAQRTVAALHYCIMNMLNEFKRNHSSTVFAIDDTYFVLAIKAIAGKVMTIAGVNSLFKNPNAYRNAITQNKTRLIMGGADSILSDPEVIDEAVELYVRLPLLVEFYRSIFDNGNKEYKQEKVSGDLDAEQIAFVPEIGNIWSNLIKNIFDKSKHIDNGVYTPENMRKIVSEVNAIYTHYKNAAPAASLVRHIVMELIAEINRRYGVIKRQELLNYYKVLNSTKRNNFVINESNYSNNDFDILNEEIEFEEKSPSDEFLNLKSTLANANATVETKVNKLTDYKILKEFRERINSTLNVGEADLHAGANANSDFLTMVDRIRLLKKAVAVKNSREDKYDLIIKAIEEAESMNQSSSDIFACFHEFVVVPLRMVHHLYKSLDKFILAMYSVMYRLADQTKVGHIADFDNDPIMGSNVKVGGATMTLLAAIAAEIIPRELAELSLGGVERVFAFGRGIAQFTAEDDNTRNIIDFAANAANAANTSINDGTAQILLGDIMSHFCHNSGGLVKLTVSAAGRITIDTSEFQTLCEYLVSNTKFMIDKFTGLVPTQLIQSVTENSREGSIYWLENKLINNIFNKINKSESERSIISIDNLNKIMPLVSAAMFGPTISTSKIITELVLNKTGTFAGVASSNALPVIRDAFTQYDQGSRIFKTDAKPITIYNTLFAPNASSSIVERNERFGLVQEFNTMIAHYLNDLYDNQSRKMYPKLFQRFANNAFLSALNGQAYADFVVSNADGVYHNNIEYYDLPSSHGILSATLAYTMKTMSTRVHPISGMKMHEVANIQEVGAHVLEKYRSCLPMYLRLFKIFLERCKFYRKMLSKSTVNNGLVDIGQIRNNFINVSNGSMVRENSADVFIEFASLFTSINNSSGVVARDQVLLFIDDMVNGISSLIEDAQDVHKELREMDESVPLFFDVKKDHTKSFYLATKDLPYAPLSTLTMAFRSRVEAVSPFPTTQGITNAKFLYGLQSMLIDDFKITVTKVPYMKKLLADFNGYNTKINNITEDKFNDMLGYLGKAFNFYYDWKFYNGQVFGNVRSVAQAATPAERLFDAQLAVRSMPARVARATQTRDAAIDAVRAAAAQNAAAAAADPAADPAVIAAEAELAAANAASAAADQEVADAQAAMPAAPAPGAAPLATLPLTYQERESRDTSIILVESINPIDSKNKVADYIKNISVRAVIGPLAPVANQNPRSRVIMINIIDLNVVPINIHSLMREIPLANLYNYAMSFDSFIEDNNLGLNVLQRDLLEKPYAKIYTARDVAGNLTIGTRNGGPMVAQNARPVLGVAAVVGPPAVAAVVAQPGGIAGTSGDSSLRFLTDVVFNRLIKPDQRAGAADQATFDRNVDERVNSKLVHNLTFLTLVQFAIKKKIKQELDFINARVVSNTAAVSDTITNASIDINGVSTTVDDNLFEF